MTLATAFVLVTMASQAQAQSGCGADGRQEFRKYKAVLQPLISARVRSLRYGSLVERMIVVSLSISKDGVVRSSEIAQSSGSPPFDAKMISLFPAGLQLPPPPTCYRQNSIIVQFPLQFRAARRL